MQHDSPHQLDVEVPQSDGPAARLAAEGERVDEQVLGLLAVPRPLPQLVRADTQGGIVQSLQLRLELVDRGGDRQMPLDLALVGIEEPGKGDHYLSKYSIPNRPEAVTSPLRDHRLDHRHRSVSPPERDPDLPRVLVHEDVERLAVGLQLFDGIGLRLGLETNTHPLGLRRPGRRGLVRGDPHRRHGLLAMSSLFLQLHDLAIDLVEREVERSLSVSPALVGGEHRGAPAVDVQVDTADARGQTAALALLRELDLSLGHAPEVALEAGQLALGVLVQLGRESARAVVQYDLHNPSI